MVGVRDIALIGVLLAVLPLPAALAADKAAADAVSLWDTMKHSDSELAPDAIAKMDGWKAVTDRNAGLGGDACLVNNFLSIVLRKGGKGAESYYRLGDRLVKGPTIVPVGAGDDKAKAIDSVKVIDVAKGGVFLDTGFVTESGKSICARFYLKKGKPFVEVRPRVGMEKALVEMLSKYAVLPDQLCRDIVLTASSQPSSPVRFPSENMLLQMADHGNAIVTCVWRSGDQRVRLTLDGAGADRVISATEIECNMGYSLSVWVAVIAAPGIWHEKKVGELAPLKDVELDWKVPFRAEWRADYPRMDGFFDSWNLFLKKGEEWEGFGVVPKKPRTAGSASMRGYFTYPGYIDGNTVYLRDSRFEGMRDFKYKPDAGVLIYPYQRISDTPAGAYGALDVLREALADTPEFTLADDIQVKRLPRDRYPATCGVTAEYERIFGDKEEKQKKTELLDRLQKMNFFVANIRGRMNEYLAWNKRMTEFCAKEKAEKPQLAAMSGEFEALLAKFQARCESGKLQERTPPAAYALTEKVEALIDSDGGQKDEKAKLLGRETRTIGGTQDSTIALFRWVTRDIRQKAAYRMMEAKDDASFEFAREIRRRTVEMLQWGFNHEGPFIN